MSLKKVSLKTYTRIDHTLKFIGLIVAVSGVDRLISAEIAKGIFLLLMGGWISVLPYFTLEPNDVPAKRKNSDNREQV